MARIKEVELEKAEQWKKASILFAILGIASFLMMYFDYSFSYFGALFMAMMLVSSIVSKKKRDKVIAPKQVKKVTKKTASAKHTGVLVAQPKKTSKVAVAVAFIITLAVVFGVFSYMSFNPVDTFFESGGGNKPGLSTTINPARGIDGLWSGTALFQDNVANPNCVYQGRFDLNLRQNGNNVAGDIVITITKAQQRLNTGMGCMNTGAYPRLGVAGTVSSSSITLNAGNFRLLGSLTSNIMKMNFESCPNQRCADGSYGTGWRGSATLNK